MGPQLRLPAATPGLIYIWGGGNRRVFTCYFWVAVKELKLSCHNSQTISFTMYPYYGTLD